MLKKKFQTQQTAISSYDYTDIASGTGYVIFYGGNLSDGTSASGSYVLSDNVFYSENKNTHTVLNTTSWANAMDITFESSIFNLPRIIEGKALINATLGHGATGGAIPLTRLSGTRIIKYDGTTETVLATVTSDITTGGAALGAHIFSMEVDIPQTLFKAGDTLRLNTNVWVKLDAGAGVTWTIAHDPADRNDSTYIPDADPTTLTFHVPFKVDL